MNQKKRRWILLTVFTLMLCLIWVSRQAGDPVEALPQNISVNHTDVVTITQPSQNGTEESAAPVPVFEIGVWQGSVAVFIPGDEEPAQILETPVLSLPQPDQSALQTRIPVYDQLQLAAYLEDYGS